MSGLPRDGFWLCVVCGAARDAATTDAAWSWDDRAWRHACAPPHAAERPALAERYDSVDALTRGLKFSLENTWLCAVWDAGLRCSYPRCTRIGDRRRDVTSPRCGRHAHADDPADPDLAPLVELVDDHLYRPPTSTRGGVAYTAVGYDAATHTARVMRETTVQAQRAEGAALLLPLRRAVCDIFLQIRHAVERGDDHYRMVEALETLTAVLRDKLDEAAS